MAGTAAINAATRGNAGVPGHELGGRQGNAFGDELPVLTLWRSYRFTAVRRLLNHHTSSPQLRSDLPNSFRRRPFSGTTPSLWRREK